MNKEFLTFAECPRNTVMFKNNSMQIKDHQKSEGLRQDSSNMIVSS